MAFLTKFCFWSAVTMVTCLSNEQGVEAHYQPYYQVVPFWQYAEWPYRFEDKRDDQGKKEGGPIYITKNNCSNPVPNAVQADYNKTGRSLFANDDAWLTNTAKQMNKLTMLKLLNNPTSPIARLLNEYLQQQQKQEQQ